jgi:hypothetical protein
MVALESGFQYSARWKMNLVAAYDIQLFKLRVDAGEDPVLIQKEAFEYMKNYATQFPGAAVPQVSGGGTPRTPELEPRPDIEPGSSAAAASRSSAAG